MHLLRHRHGGQKSSPHHPPHHPHHHGLGALRCSGRPPRPSWSPVEHCGPVVTHGHRWTGCRAALPPPQCHGRLLASPLGDGRSLPRSLTTQWAGRRCGVRRVVGCVAHAAARAAARAAGREDRGRVLPSHGAPHFLPRSTQCACGCPPPPVRLPARPRPTRPSHRDHHGGRGAGCPPPTAPSSLPREPRWHRSGAFETHARAARGHASPSFAAYPTPASTGCAPGGTQCTAAACLPPTSEQR